MLAAIEDAIIKRIKATLTYLKEVESYTGQLDDVTNTVKRMPAAYVAFAGKEKPKQQGADRFLHSPAFAVICLVRTVRGNKAARHGDANSVGVYEVMGDVAMLLEMNDLKAELPEGVNIDHFRPGTMRTLYNTRFKNEGLVAFSQEWHTKFISDVAGFPMTGGAPVAEVEVDGVTITTPIVDGVAVTEPAPELETMAADYYLQPGDDEPDASDLITVGEET